METRLCFYWKQSKVINPSVRCLRDGCTAATGFLINLALQMFCKGKRCPGLFKVVIGQRYWAGSPTAILWKLVWGTVNGLYFGAVRYGVRTENMT